MVVKTAISVSNFCYNDLIEVRPAGMSRSEWIETILFLADKRGVIKELKNKLSKGAMI